MQKLQTWLHFFFDNIIKTYNRYKSFQLWALKINVNITTVYTYVIEKPYHFFSC